MVQIGFLKKLQRYVEEEYESYWLVSDGTARRYVGGKVEETVSLSRKDVLFVEYSSQRRYVHQRDGQVNQALLNRENIQRAFLTVPNQGKALGCLKQDLKVLQRQSCEVILVFSVFFSGKATSSFLENI